MLEGITAGPDGSLWFAGHQLAGGEVGRATTDVPAPSTGNLLRNPGFDDGLPAAAPAPFPVPGWALMPNTTIITYAGFGIPAPPGAGNQLMWGGLYDTQSAVIQQVDVSGQAAGIDAGRGEVTLSALLGGFDAQADDAFVVATFLSATDGVLGVTGVGPVSAADRGNVTGLLPRVIAGGVPAGTRAIRVEARMVRVEGVRNDGLVDDVSLTLDVAPEPGSGGGGAPGPGGGAPGGGSPGAVDRSPPSSRIDVPAAKVTRAGKLRKLTGTASDDRGVARVDVAVLRTGKSCAQLDAKGRFRRVKGRCSPTVFLRSKGTARWSLKLPAALPAGSFAIYARATDTAGRQATRRLSLRLR